MSNLLPLSHPPYLDSSVTDFAFKWLSRPSIFRKRREKSVTGFTSARYESSCIFRWSLGFALEAVSNARIMEQ